MYLRLSRATCSLAQAPLQRRDHAGPEDVAEAVDAHGDRHDAGVDVEEDLVSPSSTTSMSDTRNLAIGGKRGLSRTTLGRGQCCKTHRASVFRGNVVDDGGDESLDLK
ncbi:hypothetical protein PG996_012763 [Apiospora saccharicola]|uniref:Uncharacterized protein n=1 Tax=Apiospora saccharicola TaxID=335842 RepID=A0ABR1U3I2_9PEZI